MAKAMSLRDAIALGKYAQYVQKPPPIDPEWEAEFRRWVYYFWATEAYDRAQHPGLMIRGSWHPFGEARRRSTRYARRLHPRLPHTGSSCRVASGLSFERQGELLDMWEKEQVSKIKP